jgi:hypothetical protein
MGRIAIVAVAATAVAGLSACHRAREFKDAQLTRLLRVDRALATDPQAPLDPGAIDCMRAWSGDADIAKGLPPAAVADAAKSMCRQKVDGWIADADRNPDKITFDELTRPPTVRQAEALLMQHRGVARMPGQNDRPPPTLMQVPGPPPNNENLPPADVTTATAAVNELDTYCQKAKQAAASSETSQQVGRFASYCDKRIDQLRARISMLQQHGTAQQVQALADNVQRTIAVAKQVEARENATKNK